MWQYIIVGVLLLAAVWFVFKTIKNSFKTKHDCPSCDVADVHAKMANAKKHGITPKNKA